MYEFSVADTVDIYMLEKENVGACCLIKFWQETLDETAPKDVIQ